jgi:hypothetical protein
MIRTESSVLINKPLQMVYRYVAEDFFVNYPNWSPEVITLEKTSPGPLCVGTTGRQVRNDAGYVNESTFRVTTYQPPMEIAFTSTCAPHYRVRYAFQAVEQTTRLTFIFELTPTLLMNPFKGLISRRIRDGGQRVVNSIRERLEE